MIDRLTHGLSFFFALTVFLTIAAVMGSLLYGGLDCFQQFGWDFLITSVWNPAAGQFGALVPVIGTLSTAGLALLIALPVSFGISYCITEIIPPFYRFPFTIIIELLAVIPSIIYGMWGLFVFIPYVGLDISVWLSSALQNQFLIGQFFTGPAAGLSILTASFILAIMIIPFITVTFKDAFDLVPLRLKESGYALGCTTWEIIWHIIVPHTRTQLVGGTMLGLTRALGETMAVAFVIGNAYNITSSVLQPGTTIASSLANEFTEAESDIYTASLISIGLILFLVTIIISGLARYLLVRLKRRSGGRNE